jgi:hypothetical protein
MQKVYHSVSKSVLLATSEIIIHLYLRRFFKMAHNYTRQRQGRDFPSPDNIIAANKSEEHKRSLLSDLTESIAEAERAKTPVDGLEPEGLSPERVR